MLSGGLLGVRANLHGLTIRGALIPRQGRTRRSIRLGMSVRRVCLFGLLDFRALLWSGMVYRDQGCRETMERDWRL